MYIILQQRDVGSVLEKGYFSLLESRTLSVIRVGREAHLALPPKLAAPGLGLAALPFAHAHAH